MPPISIVAVLYQANIPDAAGRRPAVYLASPSLRSLPVLAGLRPGVVAALVEAGAEVEELLAARDLDAAYALLEEHSIAEP